MAHKFVYTSGNHGQLIRACENCICTAVYNSGRSIWEVVHEENGKFLCATDACNGTPAEEKKGITAAEYKARNAKKTAVADCYCDKHRGKGPHYPDATDCYCTDCKGRQKHYG